MVVSVVVRLGVLCNCRLCFVLFNDSIWLWVLIRFGMRIWL